MKKIAVVLVLGMANVAATGAEEAPVFIGSRVRLHTSQGTVAGNVLKWEGGHVSLINTGYGDPLSVPEDSIQGMELSRGKKRPWLKGTLVGMAIGGLFMAAAPLENPCPPGVQASMTCETKASNVQAGLLGGGIIGLVVGASRRVDRWESVPPPRFRVGLAPVPGGAAAVVTIGN